MSFAKNMSNKYSQKILDTAKKSTTDAIKTASKRAIQKTAEGTGDLIGKETPFINCKIEINNTGIDNAKDIDIVMPMYDLIKYSDNYSKTSGSIWQNYRDEPNNNLTDFALFKSKMKITGDTPADGNIKDAEIIVPFKYFSNFWRTLEMPLINCEVNLILTW